MKNNYILNPEQANIIWKTSWLILMVSIYGVYRNYYDMAICPFCIFLTSINYWRKQDSWKRNLDIFCVRVGVIYTTIRSYNSDFCLLYNLFVYSGIFSYLMSKYYYSKQKYWLSTYCHLMLHIFGNVANIILYSGYISPLNENQIILYFIKYIKN